MPKSFVDGVALGAFLTLLAFLFLALIFDLRLFETSADSYIQTLVTSAVTAAAAYLALRGIRDQIQQNFQIEGQRKHESLRAARSALPMALSEITKITRAILLGIFQGSTENMEDRIGQLVSPAIMETLQKCIQFSDPQSGERLAQIIRYIQVLQARYDDSHFEGAIPTNEHSWLLVGHNRISYAIGWAVLDALCGSAFGYARGSRPEIPAAIDLPSVYGVFIASHVMPEDYPLLVQTIEQRAQAGRLEMSFAYE